MSVEVELAELAGKAEEYPFAYLITVGEDLRAKPVGVQPRIVGIDVTLPSVGVGTRSNITERPDVVLLYPPAEPGGYSLFVDGRAEVDGQGARMIATHAVLHRPADR